MKLNWISKFNDLSPERKRWELYSNDKKIEILENRIKYLEKIIREKLSDNNRIT